MARWVTHPEVLDEIDGAPLLGRLADEVVTDAVGYAHQDTGDLKSHIHKSDVEADSIFVVADPVHDDEEGFAAHYGYWAEVGTSDTPAERFLEKALFRERQP